MQYPSKPPGRHPSVAAKARKSKNYAVVTCDIMGSRGITGFQAKRAQRLTQAAKLHLENGRIISEYAITAWDEFEGILTSPKNIPVVLFDLRRRFRPFQLWIGVGIGTVSGAYRKPINQFAGGEAFERARAAVNASKKKQRAKTGVLTSLVSGNELFDSIANTVYHLHDTLLQSISPRQWQTIDAFVQYGRQDLAAKRLHLHESTVSRNLRRGHWWQITETQSMLARVIEALL